MITQTGRTGLPSSIEGPVVELLFGIADQSLLEIAKTNWLVAATNVCRVIALYSAANLTHSVASKSSWPLADRSGVVVVVESGVVVVVESGAVVVAESGVVVVAESGVVVVAESGVVVVAESGVVVVAESGVAVAVELGVVVAVESGVVVVVDACGDDLLPLRCCSSTLWALAS